MNPLAEACDAWLASAEGQAIMAMVRQSGNLEALAQVSYAKGAMYGADMMHATTVATIAVQKARIE